MASGCCRRFTLTLLALAAFSSHGFFQQFNGLRHLLQVAGVEAHVFLQLLFLQAHAVAQLVSPLLQGLGVLVITAAEV